MNLLNQKQINQLILGSSLLATGGGGSILSAQKLARQMIKKPQLVSLDQLSPDDLVITVFGIGGQEKSNPALTAKKALIIFQKTFKKKVKAIVPVEIGPLATMTAVFISSFLNLPLVDGDIVGFRSSPEVFLETITIPGLSRFPSVAANNQGQTLVIKKNLGFKQAEKVFRRFAVGSGGDAFVIGYPLTQKKIKNIVAEKSLSFSVQLGKDLQKLKSKKMLLKNFCLQNGFTLLGKGTIFKEEKMVKKGFRQGKIIILQNQINLFELFIKNENIVLRKNNKTLLTTPDLICLLDLKTFTGINNFLPNKNKKVAILAKKAIPIWQTRKGKKLFSPENLGLSFKQKLL